MEACAAAYRLRLGMRGGTCGAAMAATTKFPASKKPTILSVGGATFLPRGTVIYCVDVVPAPRYTPATARPGSGGLKSHH